MEHEADIYEWDEAKSRRCLEERGFDFSIVHEFDWGSAIVREDTRRDYGEPRYRAFGYIGEKLFAVVFTPRGGRIRIISVRRANRREERRYGRPQET